MSIRNVRGAIAWWLLPKPMRARLLYTDRLAADLFISLPASTKKSFVSHAQGVLRYPTFIETGTCLGDMSQHASQMFRVVHTIELGPELAMRSRRALAGAPNVTVHQGDSGSILGDLLRTIDTSCMFWLDGHYSGGTTARGELDTPILAELEAISSHHVRPHAILIDDARVFGADGAYPTLEEVILKLRQIDPAFKIAVSSDIIWAAPAKLLDFRWCGLPSGAVLPPSTDRR